MEIFIQVDELFGDAERTICLDGGRVLKEACAIMIEVLFASGPPSQLSREFNGDQ